MSKTVSMNGVQVYALSQSKSLPSWVPEKKRLALHKDAEFRRKIDLIQDFGFPSAAQTLTLSGDGRYIIATGTYPPRVRVYDTKELSLKFERFMDSASVATVSLSEDYGKIAFLQDDRHVEVHAAYGRHYRTRIPTFGRGMAFHAPTAELLIASGTPEVYRLNLEEGRFLAPLRCGGGGGTASTSRVAVSRVTALLAVGTDGGEVEVWDPRDTDRPAARLAVPPPAAASAAGGVSALCFDERSLSLGVGTADGRALVYDLRKRVPSVVKAHQYGTPVHTLAFHRGSGGGGGGGGSSSGEDVVVSADARIIKLWHKADGSAFANIEAPPGASLHAVALVPDEPGVGGGDTGLLIGAGETARLLPFYLPALGTAPRWAAFLDSLTEELGEGGEGIASSAGAAGPASAAASNATGATVYDDFRFVTREELGALGLAHLVGTPLLRAYMHGFFMDAALHARVTAVADPGAYDKWRAARVRGAVEAGRASRIAVEDSLPAVNRGLAARLRAKAASAADLAAAAGAAGGGAAAPAPGGDGKRARAGRGEAVDSDEEEEGGEGRGGKRRGGTEAAGRGAGGGAGLLTDSRFSALFANPDYTIDEASAEFLQVHPTAAGGRLAPGGRGASQA